MPSKPKFEHEPAFTLSDYREALAKKEAANAARRAKRAAAKPTRKKKQ